MDTHDLSAPASAPSGAAKPVLRDRKGRVYQSAIGPRLKPLLYLAFIGFALLGATGVYLSAIRVLEWWRAGKTYTNPFTLGMFMVHVVIGAALVAPFLVFGFAHWLSARKRTNRRAIRLGIILFISGILVCLSGLALIQLQELPQLPTGTMARNVTLILHVALPIVAVALYVLHRKAGPKIRWKWGYAWGVGVSGFVAVMMAMHTQNPRQWNVQAPREGEQYFEPSKLRTSDNNFISAQSMMMDEYCLKCHQDIYNSHLHSAHKRSSFNNPPYLFSVRQTREVALKRDGNVKASRWCAGCHDVVPFVTGAFDDPKFDDVNHPTSQAGLTCTVCHAITHVNSTVGNADYVIEEPLHYPFAYSDNPILQWLNNQVVKAKPDFHKKTFLKPFHKTAEFCSTCHKVSLPMELNHYKEFLRGQDHYATYLLSGVGGHNARAFYYPPVAKVNCAECHMPLSPSQDFGSRDFDQSGTRKVHNHAFPAANTGLAHILALDAKSPESAAGFERIKKQHEDFLRGVDPEGKDKKMRIDLFALREGDAIDGKLVGVIRPELPKLKPGNTYLVEVVLRTVGLGHAFSQGTVDSNEIWIDFEVRSGGKLIGRNGGMSGADDTGTVDEWSHFVNVLMLDKSGNRIDRRNPQDIFTPLYNHQVPPGAANVAHYKLEVPKTVTGPIELKVRLRYRKFDFKYMEYVYKTGDQVPKLPIVDICEDQVTLPVEGDAAQVPEQKSPIQPAWQRWNDYGIGMFLTASSDADRPGLRQAIEAFQKLTPMENKAPQAHGYLNLARCYVLGGQLREATAALDKIRKDKLEDAPWWTVAWFNGLVNAQNGFLADAVKNFEEIIDPDKQPRERKFDFTLDIVVIDELAKTLFQAANQEEKDSPERSRLLKQAIMRYQQALRVDSEDLEAHFGLSQCYKLLGEKFVGPAAQIAGDVDKESLIKLSEQFADDGKSRAERMALASQLCQGVLAFDALPSRPDRLKLDAWKLMIKNCERVFQQAGDPELECGCAHLLGLLYRAAHALYTPDNHAQNETVRLYSEKHEAAAKAAKAVVIYPLQRSGAPGLP
jgi:tetratricopeptide (TPR) repeat protein